MEMNIDLNKINIFPSNYSAFSSSKIFWNQPQNKFQFHFIFYFLGLEMFKFVILNKCIYRIFKNEIKRSKLIDDYSKTVINDIKNFEEIFSKDTLLNCILTNLSNNLLENRMQYFNDVKLENSKLYKSIFLLNFYNKFSSHFNEDLIFSKKEIDFKQFSYILEIYYEINRFLMKHVDFNKIIFHKCKLKDDHMFLLIKYLENISCIVKKNQNTNEESVFLCKNNKLTNYSAEILKKLLISNRFEKFWIEEKHFDDHGYKIIFEGIENSPYLTKLRILIHKTSNNILQFTNSLQLNKSLLELNLSKSPFSKKDFIQLLKGLKNTTLRTLILQNCSISEDYCFELNSYLTSNHFLESLDLEFNKIKSNGLNIIFESLYNDNHTLQELKLNFNLLDLSICRKLKKIVKYHPQLYHITFKEDIADKFKKLNKKNITSKLSCKKSNNIKSKVCRFIEFKKCESLFLYCDSMCLYHHINYQKHTSDIVPHFNSSNYDEFIPQDFMRVEANYYSGAAVEMNLGYSEEDN